MFIHPELKEGEIWLCNCEPRDFHHFGIKNKRLGVVPYYTTGEVIQNTILRPVFIDYEESRARLLELIEEDRIQPRGLEKYYLEYLEKEETQFKIAKVNFQLKKV